jgi:4'-phosphopantetheinyl transferase EntD
MSSSTSEIGRAEASLAPLLPDWVAVAEESGPPRRRILHEAERLSLGEVSAYRLEEFAAARHCAHRALSAIGLDDGPIPVGPHGAPRWPPGVSGSLTHCAGYRAAAVTAEQVVLGIDAEPNRALPPGAARMALTERERSWARERMFEDQVGWDRLLFSAKEAAFKAWFQRTGRIVSLRRFEIEIDDATRTYLVRLREPPPSSPGWDCSGRWSVESGLIRTAAIG